MIMEEEVVDLGGFNKVLKPYYLTIKIYEICGDLFDDDGNPVTFSEIETNLELLEYITEINFAYSKGAKPFDEIKEEKTKIGQLLGLSVFLNPEIKENYIIFSNGDNNNNNNNIKFKLNVIL